MLAWTACAHKNVANLNPAVLPLREPPSTFKFSRHRLVGRHDVRATVTRQTEGGEESQECMVVPVMIEDSNECTLPEGHEMHHE